MESFHGELIFYSKIKNFQYFQCLAWQLVSVYYSHVGSLGNYKNKYKTKKEKVRNQAIHNKVQQKKRKKKKREGDGQTEKEEEEKKVQQKKKKKEREMDRPIEKKKKKRFSKKKEKKKRGRQID